MIQFSLPNRLRGERDRGECENGVGDIKHIIEIV